MTPAKPRTPEQLAEGAWQAIDDLTRDGLTQLPGGAVVQPEPKVIVDLFKWLAQQQGRPRKAPKAMDDWKPPETKG